MGPELTLGMQVAGTALSMAGGFKSASAAQEEGYAKGQAADFVAGQYEQKAGQERASSQRDFINERRKMRLAQSRAIAVGAASGGGIDTGIADIIGDIASEGEFRALTALYTGEEKARGYEMEAEGKRFEAGQYRRAGHLKADAQRYSTMGGGASSFATIMSSPEAKSLKAKYG